MSKVVRSDIVEEVVETGQVSTSGIIPVYSPTNGIIEEIYVKNGDQVSDGQQIAKINSSATEQEQQAAYANYLAAKNTLDAAQADLPSLQASMFDSWDNYKNLAESGSYENDDGSPKFDQRTLPEFHISQKTWESAEARYKAQEAVIAKGQAQVANTWLLYQATQNAFVKAPGAGSVENLSADVGGNVAVNIPTTPAAPILTITTQASPEVVLALSESDITKIYPGQKANIEIAALDKMYKGEVARADNVGTNDSGVIRYNAYVKLHTPDADLRSGMTADVSISTKSVENVLSVTNSAVKPYQGGRAVRILKNNKVVYVPVRLGIRGKDRTQILSGLTEGQEIITALSNEQIKRPGLF